MVVEGYRRSFRPPSECPSELQNLSSLFLESFDSSGLEPHSTQRFTTDVNDFINFLAQRDITSITLIDPEDIKEYLDSFEAQSTASRRRSSIRLFLAWAVQEHEIDQNPIELFKFKEPRKKEGPLVILSCKEVSALLAQIQENPNLQAIARIALETGANISEILDVKIEDVHVREKETATICIGKDARRETILTPETSAAVVLAQRQSGSTSYLFINRESGKKLNRRDIYPEMKEAGKAIGRPDLSPRILRNTFIMNFKGTIPQLATKLGVNLIQAEILFARREIPQENSQTADTIPPNPNSQVTQGFSLNSVQG